MANASRTANVGSTPDQVFAVLADRDNVKAWQPDVHKVDPVGEGAIGVGSTWIETRRAGKSLQVSRVEVTEFTPGQAMAIRCTQKRAVLTFRFTLAAASSGGTDVTLESTTKGKGILGFLTGWLAGRAVARTLDPLLAGLKTHVESSKRAPEPRISEKKGKQASKAPAGKAVKATAGTGKKAAKAKGKK